MENIVAHRQPMLKQLHEEMPRLAVCHAHAQRVNLGTNQLLG
jgi:hypothetical protein